MNMRTFAVFILLLQIPFSGFSQSKSANNNSAAQVIMKQKSGEDQIDYTDSKSGYSIIIPKWWEIKETPNPNFFGGTFPEIDKSQSALLFKAFEKEKFKTFENFENWVIAGYKSGDTPKWSNDHKVLFKKNLEEFASIGKAFKVQLKTDDKFYNCCYIIVETTKSFLWIDLTSTRETYEANFIKLEKIMSQFTTL